MIIETERMLLREFTNDDLDEMTEVLGDPEVMRFSLNGPYSREKTFEFLERTITRYKEGGMGLLAVVHKTDERVIGYCGILFQEIDGEDLPEIGYRLNRQYWGRGLATEAAKAVQNYGFSHLGFSKMISIIEAENLASIRVAEKNGLVFEKDSLFKDRIPVRIYSIGRTP